MLGGARAPRAGIHQWGPWLLVGGTALVAIAVEAFRRHVIDGFDLMYFGVLIPSIIIHEVSHGVIAYWCGDDTAKEAGRLSLNPLRHVDPVGTVLLPIFLLVTFGTAFGWAKPVPVTISRLRHPRNQSVLVGLGGPAVNIVLAAIAGLALYLLTSGGADISPFVTQLNQLPVPDQLLFVAGEANVIVAVFNLIPIPPLDGSALVERLLPAQALPGYYRLRQYSMLIVLAIVFLDQGLLGNLFDHALSIWQRLCLPAL